MCGFSSMLVTGSRNWNFSVNTRAVLVFFEKKIPIGEASKLNVIMYSGVMLRNCGIRYYCGSTDIEIT